MSNTVLVPVNQRALTIVKSIIKQSSVSAKDTHTIVAHLEETPTLLNHLSLAEISKLSVLGIDLSRYMSAVHINNIKVFVVKFASDSMMRVSKLIEVLNTVEDKYYGLALNSNRLHPELAGEMIDKIQQSITASVNLMMKLTDNETLMNLFVVNMTSITDSITENREKGITDSTKLLSLESRKKIDAVIKAMNKALTDTNDQTVVVRSDAVDVEFSETTEDNK